jgi:hypothetical protein
MSEPSPRARRIVAALTDSLRGLLASPLDAMLAGLDADYARRAGDAGPGATRDAWIESRRRLAEGRAVLVATFFEGLRREALALMDPRAPQVAAPVSPPLQRRLTLVDEEELDEEGRLGAIADRHAHRASLPLLLLGQRFGVLLGRPPQDAAVLPVGPRAFGRALSGAARRPVAGRARRPLQRVRHRLHAPVSGVRRSDRRRRGPRRRVAGPRVRAAAAA